MCWGNTVIQNRSVVMMELIYHFLTIIIVLSEVIYVLCDRTNTFLSS